MGQCPVCGSAATGRCDGCGQTYCSIHRASANHTCSQDWSKPTSERIVGGVRGGVGRFYGIVTSTRFLVALLLVPTILVGGAFSGLLQAEDVAGTPAEPVMSGVDSFADSADDVMNNTVPGNRDFNESRAGGMILSKTNELREKEGLRQFGHSERAEEVAQRHAEDMAEHDYVGHTNSQMEGQQQRYAFCNGGENAAMTYFDETFRTGSGETKTHTDTNDVATGIVQQWMNSKPHREKGLLGPWASAGVGVAQSGDKVYVVMGFCSTG